MHELDENVRLAWTRDGHSFARHRGMAASKAVASTTPDIVQSVDAEGRVAGYNACQDAAMRGPLPIGMRCARVQAGVRMGTLVPITPIPIERQRSRRFMMSPEVERSPDYRQEAGTFLAIMDEMAPQVALDYSVESLQRLDRFITEHFEQRGAQLEGETLPVGVGCYLGEVIIQNLGGHWSADGRPEIRGLGDSLPPVLPLEKALKRFQNGREDSLSWYYHGLAKQAYEHGYVRPNDEDGLSDDQPLSGEGADRGWLGWLRRLLGGGAS